MKMLKFVVFALVAFLSLTVRANPLKSWTSSFVVIELEEPCVRQGGICLKTNDCPPDNLVKASFNLCPDQHHLGVRCCYS